MVVFSEVTATSTAVWQMQSFPFYDKSMRIQYAKTKSDCVAKVDCTYDLENRRRSKKKKASQASSQAPKDSFLGGNCAKQHLFILNLPHKTTSMMLRILFQQYPGYKEVSMIKAKSDVAFVEFEDNMQSSIAMPAFQGFKMTPQNPMAIA